MCMQGSVLCDRNQSATHSASEISIKAPRQTKNNEMRDSKQGEGVAISCICSCARHNVITSECTGVELQNW